MRYTHTRLGFLGITLTLLVACGGGSVDSAIVDNNQIISKENATLNARAFMNEMYSTNGSRVQFMSDSTISPSCRYGDGWASGKIHLNDNTYVDVKCQTTGSGKGTNGCLLKEDFLQKSYAKQDGQCDDTITQLPKLGG